ncbi:39S ribosomal protein L46 [Populus alba x Populus x berolinensis]|uniref:39S ribosomal protein L46 n=1 Tax=Populus alba x Populus x berolinensis TaxID=444605 RepID=A0AAD6RF97_9ROSI|nr:39S ribosomal protein L46 [Populus alba x Populus x berolinensis]
MYSCPGLEISRNKSSQHVNLPSCDLPMRFFFKTQATATDKFKIGKCEDFVWVTKDELLGYFPEQTEYLNKMIIS